MLSTYYILRSPQNRPRKNLKFYILYGAAMLLFFTFAAAMNALCGQLMWIEHRDVPGGPAAYFAETTSAWYNTLGTAASVASIFMADILMVSSKNACWLLSCLINPIT